MTCDRAWSCSKGGTDVILYASKYDGDPYRIINVCGRFGLVEGINDRFGEDIHGRLKEERTIPMRHPNGGPDWMLTEEVRRNARYCDMVNPRPPCCKGAVPQPAPQFTDHLCAAPRPFSERPLRPDRRTCSSDCPLTWLQPRPAFSRATCFQFMARRT